MDQSFINEFENILKDKEKILLVAHSDWAGDEIASLLAFTKALQTKGKKCVAVGQKKIQSKYNFLEAEKYIQNDLQKNGNFIISLSTIKNKIEKVRYRMNEDAVDILIIPKDGEFSKKDIHFREAEEDFDLIITFGADKKEDLGRIFEERADMFNSIPIINFSVSTKNEYFGMLNIVDPLKSSISELVFECLEIIPSLDNSMNKNLATILLTGIIAKTGSFLERNTKKSSFLVASRLHSYGASQSEIIEHLFKMKSLSTLKMWGKLLKNIEIDPVHKVCWTTKKERVVLSKEIEDEMTDFHNTLLRNIKGMQMSILFVEKEEGVLIQIRTDDPKININKLNFALASKGKVVPFGLDFMIFNKKIVEIQFSFLRDVFNFQNNKNTPAIFETKKQFKAKPSLPTKPEEQEVFAPKGMPFSVLKRKDLTK